MHPAGVGVKTAQQDKEFKSEKKNQPENAQGAMGKANSLMHKCYLEEQEQRFDGAGPEMCTKNQGKYTIKGQNNGSM